MRRRPRSTHILDVTRALMTTKNHPTVGLAKVILEMTELDYF